MKNVRQTTDCSQSRLTQCVQNAGRNRTRQIGVSSDSCGIGSSALIFSSAPSLPSGRGAGYDPLTGIVGHGLPHTCSSHSDNFRPANLELFRWHSAPLAKRGTRGKPVKLHWVLSPQASLSSGARAQLQRPLEFCEPISCLVRISASTNDRSRRYV